MTSFAVVAAALMLNSCGETGADNAVKQEPVVQTTATEVINVDAKTFSEVIKNGGVILDVRTPEEVAGGHIENASIIDFYDENFKEKAGMIQADKEVYVYCFSGGRSGEAAKFLLEKGHPKVYNLIGGTRAWKSSGLPMTNPTGKVDTHIQSFTLDAFNEIINSNEKVLVDFHTTWCVPCKKMAPLIDQLEKEYEGDTKILRVDLDKSKELAKHFNIRAVPTFIYFKSATEEWRGTGMQSRADLVEVL